MTATDALESLPVLDLTKCWVAHLPVYDCSSDLFEKPCAHDEYKNGIEDAAKPTLEFLSSVRIGFARADEVRKLLPDADDDTAAVVHGGDFLYVLRAENVQQPGAKARIIVRTAQNKYFTWWWKTGFRPSAYNLDPPFYVKDIRKNPQLWLTRVEQLHRLGRSNKIYLTQLPCEHGL